MCSDAISEPNFIFKDYMISFQEVSHVNSWQLRIYAPKFLLVFEGSRRHFPRKCSGISFFSFQNLHNVYQCSYLWVLRVLLITKQSHTIVFRQLQKSLALSWQPDCLRGWICSCSCNFFPSSKSRIGRCIFCQNKS